MNLKWQKSLMIALPVGAILVALVCFTLSGGAAIAQEKDYEEFDHNNFDNPTKIDNKWLPLKPGMRFVYAGTTVDEDEPIPHRVVITVTDLTKVIDGVRCVITWDLDYSAGQLAEAELAFYAQDNDGNVWRMGEYPEEYEDGEFVAAPTWLAGIQDAKAGISMQANPQPETPSYSQGWAPKVDFTDRGRVHEIAEEVCVPMGCYENVVVIDETSKAEPDAHQYKYWASGVGNIKVGWGGEGEKTQEVLDLVDFMELSPEAMAEIRTEALELEKHAYEVSEDVYGKTQPAEHKKMMTEK